MMWFYCGILDKGCPMAVYELLEIDLEIHYKI
jgi:hypothetical protein